MKVFKYFYLIIALCAIFACNDNNVSSTDDSGSSSIYVSPLLVNLENNQIDTVIFALKNAAPYNWRITKCPSWLQISESSGFSQGQATKLMLRNGLPLDTSTTVEGTIDLEILGEGVVHIKVILSINNSPKLAISDSILYITSQYQSNFYVINPGGGILNWKLLKSNPYIHCSLDSGNILYGQAQQVQVYVDVSKFKAGQSTEYLKIYSKKDTCNLKLSLNIPSVESLKAPTSIKISNGLKDSSFYITNTGNVDLSWSMQHSSNYLNISPNNGLLKSGDSVLVKLTFDRSKMIAGSNNTSISLSYNNRSTSISLSIFNFTEEKTLLYNYDIVDAKYIKSLDQVLILTRSPNRMILMNFDGTIVKSSTFAYSPLCLSNDNGTQIVVSSSGRISIVDLATLNTSKSISVSCDPISLVLTSNWVYCSPKVDQWDNLRCINLSTSQESLQLGGNIYAGSKIYLHPSNKSIYLLDMGLSPQDMEKLDIQNGVASSLYECAYHGDYAMGNQLWFSEDGYRIFTTSGNTFHASDVKSNDMTYAGNIGLSNIQYIALNSAKLCAATNSSNYSSTGYSYLNILDILTYGLNKTIKLPAYNIYNTSSSSYEFKESYTRYMFMNSAGDKAFVLMTPYNTYYYDSPLSDWALYIADLNK